MIWVDRCRQDENGHIIKPNDDWFEKSRLQTIKAKEEKENHKVSNLYKNSEVKMALEELFYDKCAYCETEITAGSPWDVEHYRPKGRVAERPDDHPGYYWLAYEWGNLYPSCTFCNQKRKDQPRHDDPHALPAQGKLDQFPLENEANRAMKPEDDLSKEKPLLLDPSNCNPEDYFIYDIQGQILPRDKNSEFAKETIRVCHLTRRRLRDARAKVINRVSKIMKLIKEARETANIHCEEALNDVLADITAPDSPYAGAARYVSRDPDAFIKD